MMNQVAPRRSMLFLPGLRADRYAKALACGPDVVCLDLEDAVAPNLKPQARETVLALLESADRGQTSLALRINAAGTQAAVEDLQALAACKRAPDMVVLPKVQGADDLAWLESMLPEAFAAAEIWAIIETAEGLEAAARIARASRRLAGLLFGGADLAAELGCAMEWEPLLYARSRVVHAAAIAGIAVMDVPCLDVHDDDGLRRELAAVRRLGYGGKAAIHPRQIAIIHEGFAPGEAELHAARRLLSAFDACTDGVCLLDGRLVELPMVRAARRVVAAAADAQLR